MSLFGSKPATPAPKPVPKPAPKPLVKELLALSKRGDVKTSDFRWELLSHKNRIFKKYKITGKEVDKFVQNTRKYGSNIEFKESRPLEKKFDISRRSSPDIKERIKSEKWSKILRDPEIFKK